MQLRPARFEIHRSQKIAGSLLLIFLLQALWLLAHLPLSMAETRSVLAGEALWSSRPLLSRGSPLIPGDSILALRCAGLLPAIASRFQSRASVFSIYAAPNRWLVRLPFALFGLWLGGALWWVARRLFNDTGGFVALALYCFSPPVLIASATVNSAILAAWGLFGLIFTAIGVAHTIYAPPRKWRPRILLLGIAIGLTAAANLSAALAGLSLSLLVMLYLTPGKRLAAVSILGIASLLGAVVFFGCFAFNARDLRAAAVLPGKEALQLTAGRLWSFAAAVPGAMLEIVAFIAALVVFLSWKRTRYFGNAAPLIAALVLPWWPGRFSAGASPLWAVPFALAFVGGIYADLFEPAFFRGRFRKSVLITLFVLVGASALLALRLVVTA
ncbi:MAG: hypothetical protein JOZ10_06290 [Acidobacteria bacterium]|nr:hypothetical protein [Acidobacteriota bacterium]MBV9436353.1 hypothetical protein [Acidobacteriota bacterium]